MYKNCEYGIGYFPWRRKIEVSTPISSYRPLYHALMHAIGFVHEF